MGFYTVHSEGIYMWMQPASKWSQWPKKQLMGLIGIHFSS